MRKLWITVSVALVLALGQSSTGTPPVPESPDAAARIALGDPAAPRSGLSAYVLVDTDPHERCTQFPAPASIPVMARLGEPIAYYNSRYTMRSIGVARQGPEKVWLVARVEVDAFGCPGWADLWGFLFVAADGTTYPPAPQGRRGEFTSYEIPAGGWATGLVFFDLPRAAVAGGAVGIREAPFAASFSDPVPDHPYGLWPVPSSPVAALPPDEYGRRT